MTGCDQGQNHFLQTKCQERVLRRWLGGECMDWRVMGDSLPDEGRTSAGSHHKIRIWLYTQESKMGFLAKGISPAEAQTRKCPCSWDITENCLIRRQCSETGWQWHRLSSQLGRVQGLKRGWEWIWQEAGCWADFAAGKDGAYVSFAEPSWAPGKWVGIMF